MEKLEREIESELSKMVEARGGVCRKWVSPGHSGVPDRLAVLPGGRVAFFEVKSGTGRLSRLQRAEIGKLRSLGCEVYVVRSVKDIQDALDGGEWR